MPSRPLLSILLPSRNRLDLLKLALASVIAEGKTHLEVVISDNASDQDYGGYLARVKFPIRYIRHDQPLSVTENWNRALEAAEGRYVVMLGDDDALSPGFVRRILDAVDAFDQPEAIYMMAYHYAYPGVFPSNPLGYFCTVDNSPLFGGTDAPYEILPERGAALARQALRFRHRISFNAQHFVWRRDFARRVAKGAFFQSPYPDYFACFMTFLNAKRMVVVPTPQIIIGIARQSYGFFHANNRESEGQAAFLGATPDEADLARDDAAVLAALRFPGSQHYRNWLIAALQVRRAMQPAESLEIDLRRYRRIQLATLAHQAVHARSLSRAEFWRALAPLEERDKAFGRQILRACLTLDRIGTVPRDAAFAGLESLLGIYHPTRLVYHEIGKYRDIMDAFDWLAERDGIGKAEGSMPSGANSPADSSSA